jgi:nucleotide-binding universal stress UspA family protein
VIAINRILCPVDYSAFSRGALAYAVAIAQWYDATLQVIHVQLPVMAPVGGDFLAAVPPPLPKKPDELHTELDRFVQDVAHEPVSIRTVVLSGDPAECILTAALDPRADLIVMGTHGHRGFERLMLGSVAERVLRKAACPVMTIPPAARAPVPGPVLFKRIVCGIDFSPASEHAVQYALSLAGEAGGEITLSHCLEGLGEGIGRYADLKVPEHLSQLGATSHAELAALIPPAARESCKADIEVSSGTPWRELVRIVSERKADLVVLGIHGRNPVSMFFFGSTTNQVVRHATCPVLTIRADVEPTSA